MRFQPLRVGFLAWLAIAAAVAQDQTGRVEGVVVDAVSHQPVKKATVSINFMGGAGRGRIQNGGPQTAITDSTGAFSFSDLPAGKYQINVMQQNYPETPMGGVHKTVEVSAGDTAANVTVELMPGAAISGHIVDEDGDPLNGCLLQPHPAKNFNQGVPMMRVPEIHDDGSYRMFGIPAGKYIISAQCSAPVFQPRPLSEGPDPPPSSAYPVQYYSATSDIKSAEVVELSAGAEKSGVDFQMRPVPVTHIHGTFANGSADWRGHGDLQIQLVPLDQSVQRTFAFAGGVAEINGDGTFDIRQVFPGSYQIVASSQDLSAGPQSEATSAVGGVVRVDVANKPLDVSLPLYHAVDISGRVEFERNNNTTSPITPAQINLQLEPKNQFSSGPKFTQVNEDGSFTIKSVLPGEWRIRVMAPNGFMKSARLGGDDVTDRPFNLASGAAGPLQIVVSTNTARIQGTAPGGEMVFAAVDEDEPARGWRMAQVDSNGQFTMEGLPPGKYRVAVGENGAPMPEGGQEISLAEGETATIEVKPETKP
ncbi:MAG: carboxypeptidase regulatory-like domain-containing protein [Bryobacteraceae bacterium]